jgi:plasmid maintenance system antidote protein VapI
LTSDGGSFTNSEAVTKGKAMAKRRTKQKPGKIPLSDQLRQAIDGAELSRYRIAKEAGVAQSTISQFMNGKRSLSLQAIDRIAELLDLELVTSNTTPNN